MIHVDTPHTPPRSLLFPVWPWDIDHDRLGAQELQSPPQVCHPPKQHAKRSLASIPSLIPDQGQMGCWKQEPHGPAPLAIYSVSLKMPFPSSSCWGHKQRHMGQIQFGAHCYCPEGDGEKENGLSGSKCCFSSRAHSPTQSCLGPANTVRASHFCSNSALMDVWGYLAQKLHLLYRECNGMV